MGCFGTLAYHNFRLQKAIIYDKMRDSKKIPCCNSSIADFKKQFAVVSQ